MAASLSKDLKRCLRRHEAICDTVQIDVIARFPTVPRESSDLGTTEHHMGADLNVDTQNGTFTAFPWGAASKRRGNDEDAAYRRNARFFF